MHGQCTSLPSRQAPGGGHGGGRAQAAGGADQAELKAAAIRAFARLGYLNTKIVDITAKAGRAAGSFYTHFANKEALLEALLADLLAEGDTAAAAPGHGDDFRDRDAVRWHVATYWDFYRRYRTIMVPLQQAATVDDSFARRSRELMEPDLRHVAEHLKKLDLPSDPLVVASMFTTLLSSCADLWPLRAWPAPRPAVVRQ